MSSQAWHLHKLKRHMPEDLADLFTAKQAVVTAFCMLLLKLKCAVIKRKGGCMQYPVWLDSCASAVTLSRRRARFKRSNSVTASVQADLDPEGFSGLSIAVPTQDKSLQFGCSFQRHSSEPESASQYSECHRTVHTQGQWAYREVGLHNVLNVVTFGASHQNTASMMLRSD